jgi:hypothetical protein
MNDNNVKEKTKSIFDDKFSITLTFDPNQEDGNHIIYSYPDNLNMDDVYVCLGTILVLRQEQRYKEHLIAEKEHYKQLSFFKKVMYKIGNI